MTSNKPKPLRIEAKDPIHKKRILKKWSLFHLGKCEPFSFGKVVVLCVSFVVSKMGWVHDKIGCQER